MTLLPADAYKIEPLRGDEWPPYKVPPLCALATCSSLNVETHHIVRRSWTVGPYDWVEIDGFAVGNKIPLCYLHHRMVTDNEARIVWNEDDKRFYWVKDGDTVKLIQPPSVEIVRSDPGKQVALSENCPTCGHKLSPSHEHYEDRPREEKRPRKTWTITVPSDAREVGADVLDTLLESARLILDDRGLSYGPDRGVRYFILSTSLGLFVAHAEEILS